MPDYDTLMALKMRQMMAVAGKNPMMGNSRGGQGGTYTDPTTGQIISSDTSQQTTRDQRTIAGLQNAQQYLGNVIKQMPQFVTGWQKVGLGASGFGNNWLGTNFPQPSQHAQAQASLKSAAEGVINGFGLNATGENVQTVIGIMKPEEGESPQYYQQRVMQQMADFSDQQHRAEDRVAAGIPVGNANAPPQTAAQAPKYSDEDIAYTAQKRGLSVAEVKKRLGVQ
jgi:hypothetical protein